MGSICAVKPIVGMAQATVIIMYTIFSSGEVSAARLFSFPNAAFIKATRMKNRKMAPAVLKSMAMYEPWITMMPY